MGVLGFDSRRGLGIFFFTTASRTALGPTQAPIQWVPRALSLGIKRVGREADHSLPFSAEVKNTSTRQYVFMAWYLVKHRDNFTFYLYICRCNVTNLRLRLGSQGVSKYKISRFFWTTTFSLWTKIELCFMEGLSQFVYLQDKKSPVI
jgi:hypothetical protein